jgi:hypothetical protein
VRNEEFAIEFQGFQKLKCNVPWQFLHRYLKSENQNLQPFENWGQCNSMVWSRAVGAAIWQQLDGIITAIKLQGYAQGEHAVSNAQWHLKV